METSVIIRTKNEEKWISATLDMLERQIYRDFEIVIVDSDSTDKTLEIIKKYPTKLVSIPQKEFSYPHALNVGCRAASAEKYFVIMSAHSVPMSETFLSDGMSSFISDKVMGVYGPLRTLPDGSVWEKLYFNFICGVIELFSPRRIIFNKDRMGILGNTNSIIRRDLWEKYDFNEAFGLGGEDQDWVRYWTEKGFVVVKDKRFKVMHSHSLGLSAFLKQWKYWASLTKPQDFKKISFRGWNW